MLHSPKMRAYRYHLVNVFVESNAATFGGNPLCVFENAHGMEDAEMQALAAQFNLSETTFVLPRENQPPQVRIFTPAFEMPFAGHPTIGTAFVVNAIGLPGCTGNSLTLNMKAGDIAVTLEPAGWTLTANAHTSRESGISRADTAEMLAKRFDRGDRNDQLLAAVVNVASLLREIGLCYAQHFGRVCARNSALAAGVRVRGQRPSGRLQRYGNVARFHVERERIAGATGQADGVDDERGADGRMPGKWHFERGRKNAHLRRLIFPGQNERRFRQIELRCQRLHFGICHAMRVLKHAQRIATEGGSIGFDENVDQMVAVSAHFGAA